MSNITCEVVRDLLPLYADDAVSPDSRALVEEHLSGCEACRKELESCKIEVRLPPETGDGLLKQLKAKLLRKKIILALTAVLSVSLLLFAVYYCMVYLRIAQPYDPGLLQITGVEGNVISYTGSRQVHCVIHTEEERETDGQLERIVYIGFADTVIDRISDARSQPGSVNRQGSFDAFASDYPISRVYYKMPESWLEFGPFTWKFPAAAGEPVLLWEADGAPLFTPIQPQG